MTLAARRAEQVARNHGRDPWRVARRLRLRVRRADLPRPHREMYAQRHRPPRTIAALAIAKDADDQEARELVAHGIAHHLLHVGDRVTGKTPAIWSGRHEREANDFAALLLIPGYRLKALEGASLQKDVAELAEACEVSEALARRRLGLG